MKTLTDEQINVAIAEAVPLKLFVIRKPINNPFCYYRENACGYTDRIFEAWKVTEDVARKYICGKPSDVDRVVCEPAPTPNYCNDLNAMHKIIWELDDIDKEAFEEALEKVVNPEKWIGMEFEIQNATARQRAEAFLLTVKPELFY